MNCFFPVLFKASPGHVSFPLLPAPPRPHTWLFCRISLAIPVPTPNPGPNSSATSAPVQRLESHIHWSHCSFKSQLGLSTFSFTFPWSDHFLHASLTRLPQIISVPSKLPIPFYLACYSNKYLRWFRFSYLNFKLLKSLFLWLLWHHNVHLQTHSSPSSLGLSSFIRPSTSVW